MAASMTGFGEATSEKDGVRVTIQIKSVNGRFLETRFRLPRDYFSLEVELKKILQLSVARGSVEINVQRQVLNQEATGEIALNLGKAKAWLKAYEVLGKDLGLTDKPALSRLMDLPGVLATDDALSSLAESEKTLVTQVLKAALIKFSDERGREGQALQAAIEAQLSEIARFAQYVEGEKARLKTELQTKLLERLKTLSDEIGFKGEIDQQRYTQEVIFLTEKADITEEIDRLKSHLEGFKKAFKEMGTIGKKLEFMTQELHREVNTIGSKTNALNATLNIIEAKGAVEKIREQIQNIE